MLDFSYIIKLLPIYFNLRFSLCRDYFDDFLIKEPVGNESNSRLLFDRNIIFDMEKYCNQLI